MLLIEECKKILNINGTKYTDEEIKKIRDLLRSARKIFLGFNSQELKLKNNQ